MLHSINYGGRGQETYSWFVAAVSGGVLDVPPQGIELGTPTHRDGMSRAGA
jgi:hypothetical protein